MKHIISGFIYFAIGFLILIQQGETDLLVNDWRGLAFACLSCFSMGVINIMLAAKELNTIIERAPRNRSR